MNEEEIREKIRIEEDERAKIEEKKNSEEGKGCFFAFIGLMATMTIIKAVLHLIFPAKFALPWPFTLIFG